MPPEDSGAQSYYLDFRNSPYYLPARIAVTGSVPKPGSYAHHRGMTVGEALRAAGAQSTGEDLVLLLKTGGARLRAEVAPASQLGRRPLDRLDVVAVLPPADPDGITVVGEVRSPDQVVPAADLEAQDSRSCKLQTVLEKAGGISKTADPRRVVVVSAATSGTRETYVASYGSADQEVPLGSVVLVPRRGTVPVDPAVLSQELDLQLSGVTLEAALSQIADATGGAATIELDPSLGPDARSIMVDNTFLRGASVLTAVTGLATRANLQVRQTATGLRVMPQSTMQVLVAPRSSIGSLLGGPRSPANPRGVFPAASGSPLDQVGSLLGSNNTAVVPDLGVVGRRLMTVQYPGAATLRAALSDLLTAAGVSFVLLGPQLPVWDQPVVVNLVNQPLTEALRVLLEQGNLQAVRERAILRIGPKPGAGAPGLQARPTASRWRLTVQAYPSATITTTRPTATDLIQGLGPNSGGASRTSTSRTRTQTPRGPTGVFTELVLVPGVPAEASLQLPSGRLFVYPYTVEEVLGGGLRLSYGVRWVPTDRAPSATTSLVPVRGTVLLQPGVMRTVASGRPDITLSLVLNPQQ
jgi:protein involved in polysaccharide export with SLBB domain